MNAPRPQRLVFALLLLAAHAIPVAAAAPGPWVATWMAAPDSSGAPLPPGTIRQVVRTSAGGTRVRIRLSNLFGAAPLAIGGARLAVHERDAAIRPGSSRALTFGGAAAVTIAKGESVVSDAVDMAVAPLQELALSLFLPDGAQVPTLHGAALQTAYLAAGDKADAGVFPAGSRGDSRYFLTDVEVEAAAGTGTIVVVGDSIADGIGSTQDANARWPDVLAQGLRQAGARPAVAVVNAGIAGNRLLRDGAKPFVGPATLARFERDALSKPGVRLVVLAHGLNDIVAADMLAAPEQQASAGQIIDGMRRLIAQAHAAGVRIWGATLAPLGGVEAPFVHSGAGEAKRRAVNAWIRDGGEFDAVLDFDELLRDAARPDRLLARFDSGDHLHPNDAGYRAMGEAASALWQGRERQRR